MSDLLIVYLGGKVSNPDNTIAARKTAAWVAAMRLSRLSHSSATPLESTCRVKLFKSAVYKL